MISKFPDVVNFNRASLKKKAHVILSLLDTRNNPGSMPTLNNYNQDGAVG
jgi:hypothetical protein